MEAVPLNCFIYDASLYDYDCPKLVILSALILTILHLLKILLNFIIFYIILICRIDPYIKSIIFLPLMMAI
jgi:hypothetical protein